MPNTQKILIVDDIKDVRNTLAGVLSDRGHFVSTASSNLEVMAQLKRKQFDFIVTDIRLSGDDDEDDSGLQLVQKIREHNINSQIILMTGKQVMGSHFTTVREHNVLAYIEKTDDWVADLVSIIDEAPLHDDEVILFFKNMGFEVNQIDEGSLVCTTDRPLWQKLPKVYVHLVLERELDLNEFQNLSQVARDVFGSESTNQIVFVVIDKLPNTSDLHQIFALRSQRGFIVIPLSKSLIASALHEGREVEYLTEQVNLFTGQTNHYDTRTEVSDLLSFFGRHALLENLKHSLVEGKSAIIFGVRKIGKSSLLARLRQDTDWPIATLNVQGYIDELNYVYIDAIDSWQRELQTLYPKLLLPNWADKIKTITPTDRARIFREAVKNFVELASHEKGFPGLFLFIDEMDLLLKQKEYNKVAALLRSLVEDHYLKGRFALLMAGLDPIINRTDRIQNERNPFYSFFQENSVGPLSPDDTFVMVNALGRPMGITFTDDALQLLIHAGGCHPFLTRQLCSRAIQDKSRPVTISLEQTTQAIEGYLNDPQNYMVETLWPLHLGGPPATEAHILKTLASQQPCSKNDLIFQDGQADSLYIQELALKHLADQSIIKQRREDDRWEISIPIYRNWIRRNILNLPTIQYTKDE